MLFALIAMDLVWALGLIAVATPAAWSALRVFTAMTSPDPMHTALALVLALATPVAVFTADVCAVLLLLPKPRAGSRPNASARDDARAARLEAGHHGAAVLARAR